MNPMLDLIDVTEQPWISYARALELVCGATKDSQLMPNEHEEPRVLSGRKS